MTDVQREEWAAVAEQFGVDLEQVRRDHLVSHVLGAIAARVPTDDVVFFGGTAHSSRSCRDSSSPSRSRRRSSGASPGRTAARPGARTSLQRRGFSRQRWPSKGIQGIQVQLVSGEGYLWPTEIRDIEQRYTDAPPARLRTLTAAGFAANKLTAWIERRAPRDLYDLWALAERGLIDDEALDVFVRRGPTGRAPADWVFDAAPDETRWRRSLSHQTRLRVTAAEAVASVRAAWAAASS